MPAFARCEGVCDGDTLHLGGVAYRLWGIDAPELHQICPDGWPAGVKATETIAELMRGKQITCEGRGHDRYGRTIALCRADGQDIGAAMVRVGMAWAFVRYSSDYVGIEAEASRAGLGIHAHNCLPAWEWRELKR